MVLRSFVKINLLFRIMDPLKCKSADKGIACQMIQKNCEAPKLLGRLCNSFVSLCRGHILPCPLKMKKIEYNIMINGQ